MEQMSLLSDQLNEFKKRFNEYPDHLSNLAQNEIDLTAFDKNLKSKSDELQAIANLSQKFQDLLKINCHILYEFKKNQEKDSPDFPDKGDSKIILNYLTETKLTYQSLTKTVDLLNNLNSIFTQSSAFIFSFETWFRSIEQKINEDFQNISSIENYKNIFEECSINLKNLNDEISFRRIELKTLEKLEENSSIIYEKITNLPLKKNKLTEFNSRLNSIETKVLDKIQFLTFINEYLSYLDKMNKTFESIQINDDLTEENISKKVEDLRKLKSNLQEKFKDLDYSKNKNTDSLSNIKKNILALSQQVSKKHNDLNGLNNLLKSYESNMKQIQMIINKSENEIILKENLNNIENIDQILECLCKNKNELENSKVEIVGNNIYPIIKRIETEYVPDVLENYKLTILVKSTAEKNEEIDRKIDYLDEKISYFSKIKTNMKKYFDLVNKIDKWIFNAEQKLSEPLGKKFEELESQYEINEEIMCEYNTKLGDIEALNQLSKNNLEILESKNQDINKDCILDQQKDPKNQIFDFDYKVKQINQKFDSIIKLIQDRKNILLNFLDKIKTFNEEIDVLVNRSDELDLNATKINDSIDLYKLDNTELNEKIISLEIDFNKLKSDLNFFKSRIEIEIEENIQPKLKKIDLNIDSVGFKLTKLKNLVLEKNSNSKNFDIVSRKINDTIDKGQSTIDQIIVDIIEIMKNEEDPEFKLKQCYKRIENINRDEKNIIEINKFGEKFFNTQTIMENLIKINSNYDIYLQNLQSVSSFTKQLIVFNAEIARADRDSNKELSLVNDLIDEINVSMYFNDKSEINQLFDRIKSIENCNLKSINQIVKILNKNCENLNNHIHNFLIENFQKNWESTNLMVCQKETKINQKIVAIENRLQSLKESITQYMKLIDDFNKTKNQLLNLTYVIQNELFDLQQIHDLNNLQERKELCLKKMNELNDCKLNLENLMNINRSLENLHPEKLNYVNRKEIEKIKENIANLQEKVNQINKQNDICEKYSKSIKKFIKKYENLENEINTSLEDYDVDSDSYLNRLDNLNKIDLSPIVEEFISTEIEIIKTQLDNFLSKIKLLKSKLEKKSADIQYQNEKNIRDQIQKIKSNLELIETDIDHNSDRMDSIIDIKKKMDSMLLNETKLHENKLNDVLQNEINLIKSHRLNLLEKIEKKYSPSNRIKHLESKFHEINQKIEKELALNFENCSEEDFKKIIDDLDKTKCQLKIFHNELLQFLEEIDNKSKFFLNLNESSEDLIKRSNEIAERCENLNSSIAKKEIITKEKLDNFLKLEGLIENLSNRIKNANTELESKIDSLSSEDLKLDNLEEILDYGSKQRDDFKSKINEISDQINLSDMNLNIECLLSNFIQFENTFKKIEQNLKISVLKSRECQEKILVLEKNLLFIEDKLNNLSKMKYNFSNLPSIDQNFTELSVLMEKLAKTSDEIDDIKESCERMFENFSSDNSPYLMEKSIDSLIHKWNQMTRKIDETKNNINFLKVHLQKVAQDYHTQISFLDVLESSSSCNLVLNCVDPIVIKYQFEKMRTVNDDLHQNFILISEIKQDAKYLTSINRDFEAKLNHLEIDETIDGDNKYIEFLPKSASISSLDNLVNLLDSDEIFNSINFLENRSLNFKNLLEMNLNLFHRLFPICERLSLNLSNLNQSISILESDLDWLDRSNQNEISLKDKEDFFEKIYESIIKNNKLFESDIQNTICSRIIEEININNIECDELINDLNKQIQEVNENLNILNEKYQKAFQKFQIKQKNSEEIYSEMNDILEWLDMIESKFSDLSLNISHDISTIQNELNNQIIFNGDVNTQKMKARQIDLKSQQMIRQNEIEDSIEFKEKLVNIHFQLDNYIEIGVNRVNRLEEALVISKEINLTYEPFIKSISLIQDRLDLLDDFNLTDSGLESKEFLSNKLVLLEEIDRELLEKKSDLEILVKNSKSLINICESPKSYLLKFSYLSSDSNFEGDVQTLDRNSNFELKKMIDFASQNFNQLYTDINTKKEELENILWKSADLWDKIDNLNSILRAKIDYLKSNKTISAQPDKIKLQIFDIKSVLNELEKRKQAINEVKEHSLENEQLEYSKYITDLENLWSELNNSAKSREQLLNDALHFSELFWNSYNYINDLMFDLEDRLQLLESETVAIDSDSVNEQQQYYKQIIKDIDDNEVKFTDLSKNGHQLIEHCTLSDRIDIEKALEDCEKNWNRIKKSVKNHETNIQMTFSKACEFQQELIYILEEISLQQEKFVNLDSSFNSDDPKTIRFQINLLKEFKEIVDPKQMEILILNRKFDELKLNIRTNQSFEVLESLQEPLNSANKEWKRLQSSISERKSNLQNILIDMGQLSEALDEIGKSIDTNLNSLDLVENFIELNNDLPIRSIDLKMARLKMIEKEIKSQGYLLARSKDKCNNLLCNQSFENEQNSIELRKKIKTISDSNELMIKKFEELQQNCDLEQVQSSNLVSELIDNLEWLNDMDASLDKNLLYCGLPETAREQIDKFNEIFKQIELKNHQIDNLLQRAFECDQKNLVNKKVDKRLKDATENLSKKWSMILKKSSDKKGKLVNALNKACEFNEKYHEFVRWLNDIEKSFNNLKSFSKIQAILDEQIIAHQKLQISISNQREHILELDRLGTYLKYYSQKQDAILIKNLLISIQNRWEKIVSKSSNRTRDLERGYQEVKAFYDQWNNLNEWLDSKLDILTHDQSIHLGNNSIKIKQQITKHADFHRMINGHQLTYDKTIKNGRKLYEKCDHDSKDRVCIQEMLLEIKNKWKILCIQSVERQKKLEEALLCSGQFHDALNSLTEWLRKVKPTLNKNESLYGDLDNVMALIEDNQQFQKQLQIKGEQVFLINKAASEMIQTNENDEDFNFLNNKLNEMNNLWDDVEELSKDRTKRLDDSLKLASEFNHSARSCLEWLKNTELIIKQDWKKFDENEIPILIKNHEEFVKYLDENRPMIEQCLNLGNNLLENCIPEAVINLKHLITLIQNKSDEIFKLSDEKLNCLNEAFENFKKYDNLLNELLIWLQGAEATLKALDQKPLSNKSEIIDQLIKDHNDFQNELQQRQIKIDTILKNTFKDYDSYFFNTMIDPKKKQNFVNKNRLEWKASEPKLKNSRKKQMFDNWRKVWLLSFERQKKLKEHSDRLKEIERLKEFNFSEWRQRFMNWHKDNRARITDFFRRQDKDHDGKISRDEFVKGILNTSILIITLIQFNFKF